MPSLDGFRGAARVRSRATNIALLQIRGNASRGTPPPLSRGNAATTPPAETPRPLLTTTLVEEHRELDITPQTNRCKWDGGRVDYPAAVNGLWVTNERGQSRC